MDRFHLIGDAQKIFVAIKFSPIFQDSTNLSARTSDDL